MNGKITASAALCLCALATAPGASAGTGHGFYLGAAAGAGDVMATDLRQRGAVHLGPGKLPIDAEGPTEHRTRVHLGSLQLGYDFAPWQTAQSPWGITPALELEGIYIDKHSPTGNMPVHPAFLGTQYVTVPTRAGLLMGNALLTFRTPWADSVFPVLGVGAGAAFVSIRGADSANPGEPGINHFNSDPDASDTAFALQLRAGLNIKLGANLHLLTEYRYLTIDATRYTFGATDYPGEHQPTDRWRLDMARQKYHLVTAGIHYRF